MNPYVKSVRPLDDYRLEVLFENGERRLFDVKPHLRRGVLPVCKTALPFKQRASLQAPWSGRAM